MRRSTKLVVAVLGILVVLALAIGGAYLTGLIQQPTVGVQDIGDWGEVTDERTEIITTLWVDNPNQLGISVDGNARVSYQLYLNGVNVAEGSKAGVEIPSGNSTVELSTELRNQQLPVWWVAFIRNNETIPVRAETRATVEAGPLTVSPELPPINETLLSDSTPVQSSLSQVASNAEGRYTKNLSADQVRSRVNQDLFDRDRLNQFLGRGTTQGVTVGYEIQRGWATWGDVSEDATVVYFHFTVHNPSEVVAVPAEPENLAVTVRMNDIALFQAQGDDTTLQNPGDFSVREGIDSRVLAPGETKEVVYAVRMDNAKIDEWFVSHVRQGEQTDIRVEFQLLFSTGETTVRIPEESQLAYTCQLQTGILVDDQETQTTCGSVESVPGVDTSESPADGNESSDGEDEPPIAQMTANRTEGQAPLTVSFSAAESTGPNDDIVEYIWRLENGTLIGRGETVTYTFRRTGNFTVELLVVDSNANRNRTTKTVTVEPRVTTPDRDTTDQDTPEPAPPRAQANANPIEGEAPLTVEFSAAESTDPNDDIKEYIWRIEGREVIGRGETITHTFQTAGEYDVELVVIDSKGNRDTATVTISVESRV